ncbi:unnamed protein product [Protopolystoma xenopodis]|uniref:Uncharacterized protein n=1 Tax=Protopolystoma xenopodis TaxID=117903 RepID=A0A448WX03_9PLAT|nr:unnamed protein product [Protopolystoma xenopodis]
MTTNGKTALHNLLVTLDCLICFLNADFWLTDRCKSVPDPAYLRIFDASLCSENPVSVSNQVYESKFDQPCLSGPPSRKNKILINSPSSLVEFAQSCCARNGREIYCLTNESLDVSDGLVDEDDPFAGAPASQKLPVPKPFLWSMFSHPYLVSYGFYSRYISTVPFSLFIL